MNILKIISLYISHKRALGHQYHNEEAILKASCKTAGNGTITAVEAESVLSFLSGSGGPLT